MPSGFSFRSTIEANGKSQSKKRNTRRVTRRFGSWACSKYQRATFPGQPTRLYSASLKSGLRFGIWNAWIDAEGLCQAQGFQISNQQRRSKMKKTKMRLVRKWKMRLEVGTLQYTLHNHHLHLGSWHTDTKTLGPWSLVLAIISSEGRVLMPFSTRSNGASYFVVPLCLLFMSFLI